MPDQSTPDACPRCGGTAETGPGLVGCICEPYWNPPRSIMTDQPTPDAEARARLIRGILNRLADKYRDAIHALPAPPGGTR